MPAVPRRRRRCRRGPILAICSSSGSTSAVSDQRLLAEEPDLLVGQAPSARLHMGPDLRRVQAPGACSCQAGSPRRLPAGQGTAAAQERGPSRPGARDRTGNPIYLDMEGYSALHCHDDGGCWPFIELGGAMHRQRLPVGRVQQRRPPASLTSWASTGRATPSPTICGPPHGIHRHPPRRRPALRTPTCPAAIGRTTSTAQYPAAGTTRSTRGVTIFRRQTDYIDAATAAFGELGHRVPAGPARTVR